MLTRLKVSGFKNLVDVDIRLGPFTCIAGANGVGKSNLFDAIRFLSALADRPLIDAALSVRDEEGKRGDVRSLFHRIGEDNDTKMSFEADIIIPKEGFDDFGQQAKAGITFLRYSLVLGLRVEDNLGMATLEILKEELIHLNIGDAPKHLLFPHRVRSWRQSVLRGRRTSPLISTEGTDTDPNRIVKRHQDGRSGAPFQLLAANLPRTVLSVTNGKDSPTALLARREMQSWHLLQLEPSALRKPDELNAPTKLGEDGSHLPGTVYHLVHEKNQQSGKANTAIYGQIANRLAQLIEDVYDVSIDRDERRGLFTLQVTDRYGTTYPARSLSDGTLRFLALTVLELDPQSEGLLCLEEPENGIHPERTPAMLQLLQDIATDTNNSVGIDNPLRQVIINTHSPAVVGQVPDDSLLVAETKEAVKNGTGFKKVTFSCLPNTWRTKGGETNIVARGKLLAYLNPILPPEEANPPEERERIQRVIDRPDLQYLLPGIS